MRRGLLALTLLVVAACTGQTEAGSEYHLSEWAIDGSDRLAAGPVSIEVENGGDYSHTLVVTGDGGQVIGATGLVDSGATTVLELDLAAGTYVFSCRIVAEDDEGNLSDHYERGMYRTVTVTG
ncbi:MAG: hypothetical protein ACRDWS_08765 [Acidimicrobiia bacterium]